MARGGWVHWHRKWGSHRWGHSHGADQWCISGKISVILPLQIITQTQQTNPYIPLINTDPALALIYLTYLERSASFDLRQEFKACYFCSKKEERQKRPRPHASTCKLPYKSVRISLSYLITTSSFSFKRMFCLHFCPPKWTFACNFSVLARQTKRKR